MSVIARDAGTMAIRPEPGAKSGSMQQAQYAKHTLEPRGLASDRARGDMIATMSAANQLSQPNVLEIDSASAESFSRAPVPKHMGSQTGDTPYPLFCKIPVRK